MSRTEYIVVCCGVMQMRVGDAGRAEPRLLKHWSRSSWRVVRGRLRRGAASAQAATPKHYSNLKRQLAARVEGGWARVAWRLARAPAPADVNLLQARLLMMDPKATAGPRFARAC